MSQRQLECAVCGETEYKCVDGFYYCSTCNTQSQQHHTEASAVIEFDGFDGISVVGPSQRLMLRKPGALTKSAPKEAKEMSGYTFYQALTCILRQQAQQLVDFGVPVQVKCRGFGFVDIPVGNAGRKRCTLAMTQVKAWGFGVKLEPPLVVPLPDANIDNTRRAGASVPPTISMQSILENALASQERVDQESPSRKKRMQKRTAVEDVRENDVFEFTLSMTPSLLYIALLRCGITKILLSDIIRWCKKRILTYHYNVADRLPEHLQFPLVLNRFRTVFADQVCLKTYFRNSLMLAHYLEEPPAPISLVLTAAVHRLVTDLNLPKDFLCRVYYLISRREPSDMFDISQEMVEVRRSTLYAVEVKVVGYILVSLKLIFGLNGTSERVLSNHVKKYNTERPHGEEGFVFCDWFHQLRLRDAVAFGGNLVTDVLSSTWCDSRFSEQHKLGKAVTPGFACTHERSLNPGLSMFSDPAPSVLASIEPTFFPLSDLTKLLPGDDQPAAQQNLHQEYVDLFKRSFWDTSLAIFDIPDIFGHVTKDIGPITDDEQRKLLRLFPMATKYQEYSIGDNNCLELSNDERHHSPDIFEFFWCQNFSDTFDWLLQFLARLVYEEPIHVFKYVQAIEASVLSFRTDFNKSKKPRTEGKVLSRNYYL